MHTHISGSAKSLPKSLPALTDVELLAKRKKRKVVKRIAIVEGNLHIFMYTCNIYIHNIMNICTYAYIYA
jgi:hypothetical protein